MPQQPAAFLPIIEELARNAGAILMQHFRKLEGYDKKGEIDLVTIADEESEDYLVAEILKRFPDHAVLGEEGGRSGNPDGEYLWVLDPLDGTTNYAHGLRIFAVSIGLLYKGERIAGAVYAPALEELYTAARGCGAFANGERIHVSDREKTRDCLIVTGFPYNRAELREPLMGMLGEVMSESRGIVRLGAAAYDFALVASGILDAFYEVGLKPWDMAAGALLVEEAGGKIGGMGKGEPFELFGRTVLASNGHIHEPLRDLLKAGGIDKLG